MAGQWGTAVHVLTQIIIIFNDYKADNFIHFLVVAAIVWLIMGAFPADKLHLDKTLTQTWY